MEFIVSLILLGAFYIGNKQLKEEEKNPPKHTFEYCAIACESNMKLIKTRFHYCECNKNFTPKGL